MGVMKQNQKESTKWNDILLLTQRNQTKQNFACFLFCETSEISRKNVLCFAKQKKGCIMETLNTTKCIQYT
jgi:hypothetical protein